MTLAAWAYQVEVAGVPTLRAYPRLPGDKSISHRAVLLALLARGRSTISGASSGDDVRSTLRVAERLGARIVQRRHPDDHNLLLEVDSDGVEGLALSSLAGPPLDCGNSGTTMRLVAGILAGRPVDATLDGDASLRGRPMARVAEPLRAMGAQIDTAIGGRPPLRIHGHAPLDAIDWTPPVASAQVKSAILLAGLGAQGVTRVHEDVPTRDHTERMLRARGVRVRTTAASAGGATVEIDGGQAVAPLDTVVPADASAAAFWLVAGTCHPDAEVRLSGVGINPGRRGALDILALMGARIDVATWPSSEPGGEPIADLEARTSELRGVDVDPRQAVAAIDEIPVLAVAATQARGTTTFRGVGELRVKESDRLAGIVEGLTALGANVTVAGDDVRIVGPTPLRGAAVDGRGDHRLVMAFAIAGLIASGTTSISGAASAAISDPGFLAELERIRS